MYILGISAYFHDSAACLMRGGRVVAACQEERFTRIKHDPGFPKNAIKYCLGAAGISIDEICHVVFFEKPFLKLDRILSTAGQNFPKGFSYFSDAFDAWFGFKARLPEIIRDELILLSPTAGLGAIWIDQMHFLEHHQSHAASAFFPSPFDNAAVLVIDGVGEWSTTTLSCGYLDKRGVPRISFVEEIQYPHSLGLLYASVTAFLGFKVNSGEYKVMGLAPYGRPVYYSIIRDNLIDIKPDGSYKLNLKYFTYMYSHDMVTESFAGLFGFKKRIPESLLEQNHFDLAASLQLILEDAVLGVARHARDVVDSNNICLAGGVALNCVSNGRLQREGIYDDIWIQPAATDAGSALGACYYLWHEVLGYRKCVPHPFHGKPPIDSMQGSLLGPSFNLTEINEAARELEVEYRCIDTEDIYDHVSGLLADGAVVGWMQGRMEFGPRALGARSILADPRSVDMQRKLNIKIKFRESFRPFAPAVLRDKVQDWFELNGGSNSILGAPNCGYDSPYMLMVAPVKDSVRVSLPHNYEDLIGIEKLNIPRSQIPACTHVDFSARIQTVSRESNEKFYSLIEAFYHRTGVPVLINTSFNVRGEPIVCTPKDAIRCFLGCDMDYLVIENCIFEKCLIDPSKLVSYETEFSLD